MTTEEGLAASRCCLVYRFQAYYVLLVPTDQQTGHALRTTEEAPSPALSHKSYQMKYQIYCEVFKLFFCVFVLFILLVKSREERASSHPNANPNLDPGADPNPNRNPNPSPNPKPNHKPNPNPGSGSDPSAARVLKKLAINVRTTLHIEIYFVLYLVHTV